MINTVLFLVGVVSGVVVLCVCLDVVTKIKNWSREIDNKLNRFGPF